MDEKHGAGASGVDADGPRPARPASDPDYSALQTEAGHASDNPVTGGSWPQPGDADVTEEASRPAAPRTGGARGHAVDGRTSALAGALGHEPSSARGAFT